MPRLSVERRERPERAEPRAWVMPLIVTLAVIALVFVVVVSAMTGVLFGK